MRRMPHPALLDAVRRYTQAEADDHGVARTPIPGLTLIREITPTAMSYAICRPLVALVLQGSKQVTMGSRTLTLGAAESLLITADVPTVSQVVSATLGAPYLSLVFELDPAVIEGLLAEMAHAPLEPDLPLRVDPTDTEVADAALRLLRLLERPASLPVLQTQLLRELHFWLLSGRHGGAIRKLGVPESHARRVARAVAFIRKHLATPLRVEHLAQTVGMSVSSFHEHFRAITSLSPLQFQKQLRLIEARRMMLAEGTAISQAASAVGYESVSQFTREYGRLFGMPPAREIKVAKVGIHSASRPNDEGHVNDQAPH